MSREKSKGKQGRPKKQKRQCLKPEYLKTLIENTYGESDVIILFDPFAHRIDEISVDIVAALLERGAVIIQRQPMDADIYPRYISYSYPTDGKQYLWYFAPYSTAYLPTDNCDNIVIAFVSVDIMSGVDMGNILVLSKKVKSPDSLLYTLSLK